MWDPNVTVDNFMQLLKTSLFLFIIYYSFIHHLLRQLTATYKYTVKYSCTINYIYIHTDKHIMQKHIKGPYSEILQKHKNNTTQEEKPKKNKKK